MWKCFFVFDVIKKKLYALSILKESLWEIQKLYFLKENWENYL